MHNCILHISLICLLSVAVVGLCHATEAGEPEYLKLVRYLSRGDGSMMPADGNDIDIITSGQLKWELLEADIESARHYIWMEYYRWREDDAGRRILNLIIRKLNEGVEVKILLDDFGNALIHKEYYEELRRAGAQLQFYTDTDHQLWEMLPGINRRNHRKIVVIDGKVGYTGGMNLGTPNRDLWNDTHLRIQGPAVASMSRLFSEMWVKRMGPALKRKLANRKTDVDTIITTFSHMDTMTPTSATFHDKTIQLAAGEGGDGFVEESICRILQMAKHYVYIQTPYFCPTEPVLRAMKDASLRGVDVSIMIPAKADVIVMDTANSSFFKECFEAGITIFLTPGKFDHSKTIICDNYLSVIGSMNLDYRSLRINNEVFTTIIDPEIAMSLSNAFQLRSEGAKKIDAAELASMYKKKGLFMRFWRHNSQQL